MTLESQIILESQCLWMLTAMEPFLADYRGFYGET